MEKRNKTIDRLLTENKSAAIFGHIRPDGDCTGSVLGLWNYIKDNYPEISADAYIETFDEAFFCLNGSRDSLKMYDGKKEYDICFIMDCSAFDRVGANGLECMKNAKKSVCIDHHTTNGIHTDEQFIEPSVSSASEVLFYLLDPEKISAKAASCIYLGIIHDTGVFRFARTSKETFQAAGILIDKGIDFAKIINDTYLSRTLDQTKATGKVMQECKTAFDGKVVFGHLTGEEMDAFHVTTVEMNGIIDCLREVRGAKAAFFLYQNKEDRTSFKVSMRSNEDIDVHLVCEKFGGGGHVRAAGCTIAGTAQEVTELVLNELKSYIK